jgi:ADP-heptose:LPS heptosyltransferase
VLLAPAINSLKAHYPDCFITILAEQRNAGVYQLIPGVNKVYCYDCPGEFIQALRGRYDVVIDTEQWYRLSAVVARIVRAPIKIGFGTNERRRMFTHEIPYDQNAYESDIFLNLMNPLCVYSKRDEGNISLKIPLESANSVAQSLQQLHSVTFVVFFPGSSISEKRWGVERFRGVAELLSSIGIKIVVVGGKEEYPHGEVITDGGLGLNLAGLTSLSETAAVIKKSSVVVSGDSGVLHIAAGLDVPTVSLFGPGSAKKWAPKGKHHIVLNKELACSPCTMFGIVPSCQNNGKCMQEIFVDEVFNAVTMLLPSKEV